MMSLQEIIEMVSNGESSVLEFKQTTGQLDRAMKTLCGFLNDKGGIVLFGVTNNGSIIGQKVSDKTKQSIAEGIHSIEPLPMIDVQYVPIPNKDTHVIALRVVENNNEKPYSFKSRPYVRLENTTSIMPRQLYERMLLKGSDIRFRWEAVINSSVEINDLDFDEIMKTVRLGIESGRLPESTGSDIPEILHKLQLTNNGVITNAAVVLFTKEEIIDYPQLLLRLARFKGNEKKEFYDNQQVKGNVFKLLDSAMNFFFKHLSLSGKISSIEREENLSVPVPALREAIVNAICHRDYRLQGGSIGIAIFDNRVEVHSSGSLPENMTVEKLLSVHDSLPRNPSIAQVLYRRKLLESWGRGIDLILDSCGNAGLPKPDFVNEVDSFTVVFYYTQQQTQQQTQQVTDIKPPETLVHLLKTIGDKQLSLKDIMAKMKLKDRPNFREGYIKPAIEGGFVTMLYPENPKHRNQRYRLTSKGKEAIHE